MVSIRQTSLKYHGRKAATYDEIRTRQARWHWENEHVEEWLRELRPSSMLDCPVGTGRFLGLYAELSTELVTGIDVSEEMLALARKKVSRRMKQYCELKLVRGDATAIEAEDRFYDCAVCVRFLDLIDEDAMRAVVTEMCRVARKNVILTIRLGDKYVPKSNTSEHDRKKFWALVARLGWECGEKVLFRDAGWHLIRLQRRK